MESDTVISKMKRGCMTQRGWIRNGQVWEAASISTNEQSTVNAVVSWSIAFLNLPCNFSRKFRWASEPRHVAEKEWCAIHPKKSFIYFIYRDILMHDVIPLDMMSVFITSITTARVKQPLWNYPRLFQIIEFMKIQNILQYQWLDFSSVHSLCLAHLSSPN